MLIRTCSIALLASVALCSTGCSSSAKTPAPTSIMQNDAVNAYVTVMRADLSNGKIRIITDVMNLSAAEAKIFWPIYHDYETELFALGDERVDMIARFAAAQKAGKLEPKDATQLADEYFQFETKRLELLKAYHGIISKQLSPVRAAQFTQIEHRVGTVIDLLIASELPLIKA